MIKVLHVVSSLGSGGVENMLYNYYTNIDRKKIRFDFIVHGDEIGMLEEKVSELGTSIFHVIPKKISFKENILAIRSIIQKGNYDIVHCHQNFYNFLPLFFAWESHVPIRISHSHGWIETSSKKELLKNSILRFLNKLVSNYFFSCSENAGKWLHGKKWIESEKNIIMKNAIDIDKFSYSEESRKKYRLDLNIADKIVLLHVGRFSHEKNHFFMVDIMDRISHSNDNFVLLFVGNGKTEESVKKYVCDNKLESKILFLGKRSDVAELMSASDIFLLPSKYEGLGITLIEAQCTGLLVLASEKVPKETEVTNTIEYLPIDDVNIWVKKVLNINNCTRHTNNIDLELGGYSIKTESSKYEKWLIDIYNKNINERVRD